MFKVNPSQQLPTPSLSWTSLSLFVGALRKGNRQSVQDRQNLLHGDRILWDSWQCARGSIGRHTLKGLLGTLTPPQEMMMVCLMGLVGT